MHAKHIQYILRVIYSEILKFKELRESSIKNDLKEKNRVLLHKYAGTPIFSFSSIKEKKWSIIIIVAAIIGILLLLKVPREDQINYLIMLWLSILSIVLGIWASKGKH
ncbi:MAG: hypothetical protein HXS52_04300 [Theionarchaea archaeon]|nr:hypothetical protein [Theionarchaea archaeon]